MSGSWMPDLDAVGGPLYWRVAAALARDVRSGRLSSGERLPTHRALAQAMGVTVHTVTKAYAEAERSGLVVSRTGRGTFVKGFPEELANTAAVPRELINLNNNSPSNEPFNAVFGQMLGALSRRASLHGLFDYHVHPGLDRHRAAGAQWIRRRGFKDVPGERVIVCQGAQEGLLAALSAVTRPRDTVLTENLNYEGLRYIADLLNLNLRGVEIDASGLVPDALEAACAREQVAAILVNPTNHNPTTATAPLERRQAIAAIAARSGAMLVEDDIFGHLTGDETPPMAALAPDRCIYVCGTSKSIAPGLRVGYVLAPHGAYDRVLASLHRMHWSSPALMGEITTMLIESGQADEFVSWRRREARERQTLALQILGLRHTAPPASNHMWLPLPTTWQASQFVTTLKDRGVLVASPDRFTIGSTPTPNAVRLALGMVARRERLAEGLQIVADTLRNPPGPDLSPA